MMPYILQLHPANKTMKPDIYLVKWNFVKLNTYVGNNGFNIFAKESDNGYLFSSLCSSPLRARASAVYVNRGMMDWNTGLSSFLIFMDVKCLRII